MNERIKESWDKTHLKSIGTDTVNEITAGRKNTALENLATRYKRFSSLSLVMLILTPAYIFGNIFPEDSRMLILAAMEVYFVVCGVMDYWLYMGIKKIDVQTWSVAEVMRTALYYRKKHLQFVAILLPFAILVVGSMAWALSHNQYFIYGVICGACIGIAIGARQLMKFMTDYRAIVE